MQEKITSCVNNSPSGSIEKPCSIGENADVEKYMQYFVDNIMFVNENYKVRINSAFQGSG